MEEIQAANQSGEPIETVSTEQSNVTPTDAPVTTQEAPAEPQGIKVKYNKEERVIGYDEAPDWIQKGLNYDKVSERATQAEAQAKQLERVAKFYGFSDTGSYLQAIEEAEHQRQIQEEAERLGVDESVILEHLKPLRDQVNQLTQKEEQYNALQRELEIQKQVIDMQTKYSDFNQYGEKIAELVESKGYDLEDAYIIASHQEKMSRVEREVEARTIKNLQQNADSTPGSLGAEGPDEQSGYLSMSPSERRAFREKVKRGEVS